MGIASLCKELREAQELEHESLALLAEQTEASAAASVEEAEPRRFELPLGWITLSW